MCLGFQRFQKGIITLLAEMHRTFDQGKGALLALDAKVGIADFREPLTDIRKPRYLYSDTMIMGAPFCCEKQTVFVSIKYRGSNYGQT